MDDYVERMREEHAGIEGKLNKLDAFILGDTFPTLDNLQQMRLQQQGYMQSYAAVLMPRIVYETQ